MTWLWIDLVSVKVAISRQVDSGWCLEITGFVNRLAWKAGGRKTARMTSKKLAELGGGCYLLQSGGGGEE